MLNCDIAKFLGSLVALSPGRGRGPQGWVGRGRRIALTHPRPIRAAATAGFRRTAAAAGLEGARLHDLRHAFATTLLGAGVNVKVVSEALGHSSTAFTMDTCQHVLPTMGEQVTQAIEAAIAGRE